MAFSLDEKTLRKLDEIFGEKLTVSLTRLARHLGISRDMLEEHINEGTLKAISANTHVHITRPMLIDFLVQGGGLRNAQKPRQPTPTLAALKRAAIEYKEKNRKRRPNGSPRPA